MADHIEVRSTTASLEEADKICAAALKARVVACAQTAGPIRSAYWWKGKIETADEFLITMKTTADRFDEVARIIRENHSYEVPDIVAVPIVSGTTDYLAWISAETRTPGVQP